ncbi:MAG: phosphoglucomutase/phosphomannomutase family protein [Candidatus Omnitrophica bacterium]|nr:phosphoglucomutase/phosphomannomutase family protein [Candidatus Omnitrophota bacterium]
MAAIKFGTDGWRGIIAEDFTFENVRKVSQAIADYVKSSTTAGKQPVIIVGYDNRFLSEEYAKTVSGILSANDIKVIFTKKSVPTPAVTYYIKEKGLSGGIVVTASHNPAGFNGIKFKTGNAASAAISVTLKIEKLIPQASVKAVDFDEAKDRGLIAVQNIDSDYLGFIKKYIDLNLIKNSGMKLLVDYMYGTGTGYIEELLSRGKVKTTVIRNERNPSFGGVNPEPVPKNLEVFLKTAKKQRPDVAIALDGDADRIAAADARGRYLSSGEIISLILLHLLEYRRLKGTVVKTISGTSRIEKIAADFKLKLLEVPVGFKNISEIMLHEDVLIGGEESGGIGFKGYIPERDGIVSGLFLMETSAAEKKPIHKIMSELEKRYGRLYYDRIDLKIPSDKGKASIEALKEKVPDKLAGKKIADIKDYDGLKFILNDTSWLLLRASGTEPILRVYAESPSRQFLKILLDTGKRMIFNAA